jgi:hypothetical protein
VFHTDESKEQIGINESFVWVFMLSQDINILLKAANNLEVTDGNQSFSVAWC